MVRATSLILAELSHLPSPIVGSNLLKLHDFERSAGCKSKCQPECIEYDA